MEKMKISILACGWLGFPLAQSFIAQSHDVKGSTTTPEKIDILRKAGIDACILHLNKENPSAYKSFLKDSDLLVINIPPGRPISNGRYAGYMDHILKYIPKKTHVIFISSSSVYKNTNRWVDENSDLITEGRGKEIVDAERKLQETLKNRLSILRFAGLIGYDRVPGKFLANKKELSNGNSPVNLIHRDDCIGLIHAIVEKGLWGEIINGVADEHPLRKDYYSTAAKKLKITAPTFLENSTQDFKILSNKKSKTLLQFSYQFPNPYDVL